MYAIHTKTKTWVSNETRSERKFVVLNIFFFCQQIVLICVYNHSTFKHKNMNKILTFCEREMWENGRAWTKVTQNKINKIRRKKNTIKTVLIQCFDPQLYGSFSSYLHSIVLLYHSDFSACQHILNKFVNVICLCVLFIFSFFFYYVSHFHAYSRNSRSSNNECAKIFENKVRKRRKRKKHCIIKKFHSNALTELRWKCDKQTFKNTV